MTLLQTLKYLMRNQCGATTVEYALLCAMIVFVIMATVQGMANETNTMWIRVGSTMQQASA